jgi:GDP-L-fucose synthase
MIDLQNAKVLVTGGKGFLGSHVAEILCKRGANVDCVINTDLRQSSICDILIKEIQPDYVINCAARQGGIKYNKEHPVEILSENVKIGLNVIEACARYKVKKLVNILASCSYPNKEVLHEDEYFDGPPHDSVFFHGMAKRLIFSLGKAYNVERGDNFVSVCLTNLYGPRANFHPDHSKVTESVIKKIVEAKEKNLPQVEFWGDGSEIREFMFVKDAAEAVVQSLERYDDASKPLNIGSGEETTIKELVMLVANAVGYEGEIFWNIEKGGGQRRKLLDSSRMRGILDVTNTHLYSGLKETIEWYYGQYRTNPT